MEDLENELASFTTKLSPADLPQRVLEHAKLVILDTLGVIAACSNTPYILKIMKRLSSPGGCSSIIGSKVKSAPYMASMINASSGTVTELDEMHKRGGASHGAVHILPPLLALGEEQGSSGEDVLVSFLAGYEVADRVSRLARPLRDRIHPHGTYCLPGIAVSCALLLRETEGQVADAIRISRNFAVNSCFQACFEGALVRNFFAGVAAQNGMLSAELAASGVNGAKNSVKRYLLPMISAKDLSKADRSHLNDLGSRFSILENHLKLHAACGNLHSPIDATLELAAKFSLDDLKWVEVSTFEKARLDSLPEPPNSLAAKFSIPYSVAACLLWKKADVTSFSEENVLDQRVRKLSRMIYVKHDEEFDKKLPLQGARVSVHLKDGTILESVVEDSMGALNLPNGREVALNKFHNIADPIFGSNIAHEIERLALGLEELDDVNKLVSLLAKG